MKSRNWSGFRRWCREQDLNLHAFWALDPKSNASANSAIPALNLTILRLNNLLNNWCHRLGGAYSSGGSCGGTCFWNLLDAASFDSSGGLLKISATGHVVAIKNAARLVSRNLHCHRLGDASPNHVPYRGATKVVEEESRQPSRARKAGPCRTEV
jgi:hypothetical protein